MSGQMSSDSGDETKTSILPFTRLGIYYGLTSVFDPSYRFLAQATGVTAGALSGYHIASTLMVRSARRSTTIALFRVPVAVLSCVASATLGSEISQPCADVGVKVGRSINFGLEGFTYDLFGGEQPLWSYEQGGVSEALSAAAASDASSVSIGASWVLKALEREQKQLLEQQQREQKQQQQKQQQNQQPPQQQQQQQQKQQQSPAQSQAQAKTQPHARDKDEELVSDSAHTDPVTAHEDRVTAAARLEKEKEEVVRRDTQLRSMMQELQALRRTEERLMSLLSVLRSSSSSSSSNAGLGLQYERMKLIRELEEVEANKVYLKQECLASFQIKLTTAMRDDLIGSAAHLAYLRELQADLRERAAAARAARDPAAARQAEREARALDEDKVKLKRDVLRVHGKKLSRWVPSNKSSRGGGDNGARYQFHFKSERY